MALLDVNALVALAWDTHVHHLRIRQWFAENATRGWATCPSTESEFVRVSSNPKVLPVAIRAGDAVAVLAALRHAGAHRFLADDVSPTDDDVPAINGHRQVADAHLLTIARRSGTPLLTFDGGLSALSGGRDVELLKAL